MAARISLSEPVATSLDATCYDPVNDDAQLNGLIHAGIVTHKLKNPELLDMMFAMSELHDLPEVNFVAAFKKGLVFIGCPDAPPPSLADLFEPVSPFRFSASASLDAHVQTALERVEKLSQRLEGLTDALQGQTTSGAPQMRKTGPMNGTDLHSLFESLDDKMDSISKSIQSEQLQTAQSQKVDDGIENSNLHPIEHEDQLDAAFAKDSTPAEVIEISPSPGVENSDLMTGKTEPEIEPEVEVETDAELEVEAQADAAPLGVAIGSPIEEAPLMDAGSGEWEPSITPSPSAEKILGAISEIASGVRDIQARQNEQETAIAQLTDAINTPQKPDAPAQDADVFQKLMSQFDALPEKLAQTIDHAPLAAINDVLANLQQDVKRMASTPKPVLDLTEQRRSFATFTTAVSTITQRLEATADQIALRMSDDENAPSIADLLERLDAVQGALRAEFYQPVDFTRIEELTQQIGEMTPATDELAPVLEKMEQILSQSNDIPDAIASLRSEVESASTRPLPMLDLSAQRESFARFGTASAAVVNRLEACIDDLSELRSTTHSENADLKAVLEALPEDLLQALEKASGTGSQHEGILRLQRDVGEIPAMLKELAALRAAVEVVAKRPDPVLDLTQQHTGFARFGSALANNLKRMEHVADTISARTEAGDTNGPVLEQLQTLHAEVSAQGNAHSERLSALMDRLSEAAQPEGTPLSTQGPLPESEVEPTPQISPEEMRFLFAELVASQIQLNEARENAP